jgi:metal-dependent amidase/aminoacylase/carboxypeptidase family protein
MHLWPTIPSGTVASRAGPILAACDRFEILISGVGGHAAMPHLTVDPIVTGKTIVRTDMTCTFIIILSYAHPFHSFCHCHEPTDHRIQKTESSR